MPGARSRLAVIFLTVFIDLLGFGLILPVLPYFAKSFGVGGLGFGALIGIYSLMQFVATTVLGRLSDRHGRRPILLTSILLSFTGYLLFAFAGSYLALFVARLVSGLSAGNISVAQAYIADVTTPAERSRGMALVGAAFGLGFMLGPGIGGLAGHLGGPEAVGLTAAALCAINFGSAYFIVKESLQAEHRVRRPLVDVAHLIEALGRPQLGPAFIVFGLIPFAFSGYMVGLPLYAESVMGWGERQLGLLFTLIGLVAVTIQGYGFHKLSRWVADHRLAALGTFGMAIPIAAVPFLHTSGAIYGWVIVLALANSLASPALTGLISSLAGVTEQGAMLGAAQSLSALGRFTGPFLFGALYDGLGPFTAFLVAGAAMGVAWLVTLRIGPAERATARI